MMIYDGKNELLHMQQPKNFIRDEILAIQKDLPLSGLKI